MERKPQLHAKSRSCGSFLFLGHTPAEKQLKKAKKYDNESTRIVVIPTIPAAGVEPARPQRALDFESSASANSATPAYYL